MKISDILDRRGSVVPVCSVRSDADVATVLQHMLRHALLSMAVIDDGVLIGVVNITELLPDRGEGQLF